MRLLLVEDDPHLAELLMQGLRRAGWAVDLTTCLRDAEAALATISYQTMALDLGLPDGDGLEWLRGLRRAGTALPVLVLTARGRIAERVMGLDAGADDYLVKPFALQELVARITAVLRRAATPPRMRHSLGNLEFDPAAHEATVAGAPVPMPRREVMVLETLIRAAPRLVAKPAIETALGSFDRDIGANAVEVYVGRLRKRLALAGADVVIRTDRGLGYRLMLDAAG
ncbi:response regulator [Roseomonas sp. F4]